MTPEEIAHNDAAYWAVLRKIKLQVGEFSLEGRMFQKEIMKSRAKRVCYMKATQLGFTEIEVLKTLHRLIHRIYPQGVLYLFPTTDDVSEFSKSRFGPLIDANPYWIGRYVKSGGKGTDTASLKKIYDAFLYLRGARLSSHLGTGRDERESTKLRSIPVDRFICDEYDLMDERVASIARGRMGNSAKAEECYISNPTLPGFGIDKVFLTSDQRHLFRKCDCGEWSCAELGFPECVGVRQDGTGFIKCGKCGDEVTTRIVEWVPAERGNSDYMHGYQLGQLSSPTRDPAEILNEFIDPPEGNLADVYRLRLGLPYVSAEDRLAAGTVLECCGIDLMPEMYSGPCAMGVDVGKVKHVIIGPRVGNDRYELIKIIKVQTWNDIHDLIKRYNVRSAVIDIRPYEDEVRAFQKAEASNCRIFLCEYAENTTLGFHYNDHEGIVKANRTEIFDRSHRAIADQSITLPRRSKEVEEFAKQCSNAAKVLETNKRTGRSIYRYRKIGSGGDHYRNALNYYLLAASGSRIANVNNNANQQEVAETEYTLV